MESLPAVFSYEESVALDVQHEIVCAVSERSLRTGAALGACSRGQAALFDVVAARVLKRIHLAPASPITRASVAVSAGIRLSAACNGEARPIDLALASALCTIEAFMRWQLAPCKMDVVASVLAGLTLVERVAAAYHWLCRVSVGSFLARGGECLIGTAIASPHEWCGYRCALAYFGFVSALCSSLGTRVGPRRDAPLWTSDDCLSVHALSLVPMGVPQWADHSRGESEVDIRSKDYSVDTTEAEEVVRAYIDGKVREHVVGPNSCLTRGISLPPFSAFFDGPIYVVPKEGDVHLLMNLRSQHIERLLHEAAAPSTRCAK